MRERRTDTRLVGREAELARVAQLAGDPTTGAVLLTGAAGVGKSRLAEGIMADLTDRGWRGFGLSATDSAGRIPFAALSELIPETLDDLDRRNERAPEEAERAVLRAVEDALDLDGPRPIVLVIDDVASIDLPTCELLVHLATNRRLFIVANQSLDALLPEALRRLTPAAVVELQVDPLTVTGTAELAAELLGGPVGPGLVRNLQARTDGNPFFIRELVDAAAAAGAIEQMHDVFQLTGELEITPSLGRQVVFRLGLLSQTERDVLEVLALAGELGIEDLSALIDGASLEVMERRGLIATRTDQRRLRARPAHPLHAEAIVADLTPLVRRRRYRELVSVMESRGMRRAEDTVLHALARLAGGQEMSTDERLDAVYVALRLDRVREASQLATVAFDADPSERTRTAVAESLIRQGRFVEAEKLLAAPSSGSTDEWELLRRAVRRSSNQLWGYADADEAWRIDEECITQLRDPDAVARVVAHQAWIEYCDGRSVDAVARTDPLVDSTHPDVRFAVCAARAPALILVGRVDDGADLAQRAWDNGWGADTEYGSHGQHLIALGFAKLYQGDLEASRFVAAEAIKVCREKSETTALLFFLDLAAWTEAMAGDFTTALSYFEEAVETATDLVIASSVRSSLAGATVCRAQLGQPEQTAATWRRLGDIPVAPGPRGQVELQVAEGWMEAATGNPQRAAALIRAAADDAGLRGLLVLQLLALFDVARLGYATGDDASAAEAAAERCQGSAMPLIAQSIAALVAGEPEPLDELARTWGERGYRLWAAELAARASDGWSAAGDQRAATASQRASDRDRDQLGDARTPALARRQVVDPLTRREREIAALASSGARNSEIASQLHVSVRTVETHLQKIYRKLGVNSRRDLGDALARPS